MAGVARSNRAESTNGVWHRWQRARLGGARSRVRVPPPRCKIDVLPYADPAVQREYQRQYLARRRAEYMADKVCVVCGTDEQLEIHHREPSLKVSHRIWSWSRERREAELAKCEVRCMECHRGKRPLPHGHRKRYEERGCRCDPCRRAHADFQREWRHTRAYSSTGEHLAGSERVARSNRARSTE